MLPRENFGEMAQYNNNDTSSALEFIIERYISIVYYHYYYYYYYYYIYLKFNIQSIIL